MNEVVINVSGPPNSGTTTIALVIQEALEKEGLLANIYDKNNPPSMSLVDKIPFEFTNWKKHNMEKIKHKSLVCIETQTIKIKRKS